MVVEMLPLGPNSTVQNLLAAALECFKRHDDATGLQFARWILWQEPNHGVALVLLAAVLSKRGRYPSAALDYARRGTAEAPGLGLGHYAMGQACQQLGMLTEAIQHFRHACDLEPQNAEFLRVLGLALVQAGFWQEGWSYYDRRPTTPQVNQYQKPVPPGASEWRGEDLTGTNLVVLGENGYGDQIQSLRFVNRLLDLPINRLFIFVRPGLNRLLQYTLTRHPGADRVVVLHEPGVVDAGYHVSLESLAHRFNADAQTLPVGIPYLFAPPAPGTTDLNGRTIRVGLAWHGDRRLVNDAIRSMSLRDWGPLMQAHGQIQWVSLQQDDYDDQERSLITECSVETPLRREFDFYDSAYAMNGLDLVISVDTAVAHLAGALGKSVWLLNRASSEWRWGWKQIRSPWYPTMRIFHQQDLCDWQPVLQEVECALAQLRQT